jgi:hypothetical protein
MIVLHERGRNAGIGERALLPGLEEESALVTEYARLDQHDFRQSRWLKLHVLSCLLSRSERTDCQHRAAAGKGSRDQALYC